MGNSEVTTPLSFNGSDSAFCVLSDLMDESPPCLIRASWHLTPLTGQAGVRRVELREALTFLLYG